jgi:hypothetical protein
MADEKEGETADVEMVGAEVGKDVNMSETTAEIKRRAGASDD